MIELKESEYNGNKQYILDTKKLEDKDYLIVQKLFLDTKGFPGKLKKKDGTPSLVFPVKVKYEDKDITIWMYETGQPRYSDWYECGEVMDKIKITVHEEKIVNPKTKVKMLVNKYKFEKIEE